MYFRHSNFQIHYFVKESLHLYITFNHFLYSNHYLIIQMVEFNPYITINRYFQSIIIYNLIQNLDF